MLRTIQYAASHNRGRACVFFFCAHVSCVAVMQVADISRAVDDVLAEADRLSCSSSSSIKHDALVRWATEKHPEFARTYPRLFDMVCTSGGTPQGNEMIRRFLRVMLDNMERIDAKSRSFEEATEQIGDVLGQHYLPPPPPPPQHLPSSQNGGYDDDGRGNTKRKKCNA